MDRNFVTALFLFVLAVFSLSCTDTAVDVDLNDRSEIHDEVSDIDHDYEINDDNIFSSVPEIHSIDGDGLKRAVERESVEIPEQMSSIEASHRVREAIVLKGSNLDRIRGAELKKRDGSYYFKENDGLKLDSGGDGMIRRLILPVAMGAGLFTMTLFYPGGELKADVWILQGERGIEGEKGDEGEAGSDGEKGADGARGKDCDMEKVHVLITKVSELEQKQAKIEELEAKIAFLESKTDHISVDDEEKTVVIAAGDSIDTVRFVGVNVEIVNGVGITSSVNGKGNLIVGYNEQRPEASSKVIRTGSHNVVIGQRHTYSSYGGLVVGSWNAITGSYSSVTGGAGNEAKASSASISGGHNNLADGDYASISGGYRNGAHGVYSTVAGGGRNSAAGTGSGISGGLYNEVTGRYSVIGGGGGENREDGMNFADDYSWIAGDQQCCQQ